jgi:arylsulfatase A-like enzyme
MPDRPNILYIFTDQQSHEAMSCAGNARLRTPAMDALAEAGVRFDNAYCTFPLCTPARASMFTGRWPHEVGITGNNMPIDEAFRERELGHVLSAAGYECAYGGKWHIPQIAIPEGHGFRRICGFDDVLLPEKCAEFLLHPHDRPWLLVASFDNPHNICEWGRDQPLPWGDIGDPPPPEACPPLPANHPIAPYEPTAVRRHRGRYTERGLVGDYSPEDWRRLRWAYYRLTEKVDAQIGRIMEALRQSEYADDTLVIFSSDHGDQAGAHMLSHKFVFYDETARVPFIFAGAGVARRGEVDEHLVTNGCHLYLTICDYAGVEPPEGLLGHSLRPLLEGRDLERPDEYVVSEARMEVFADGCEGRMVRSRRHKYVAYEKGRPREELYDLQADGGEMVNLAADARHAEVLREHREYLREWCRATQDTFGGGHYAHPATPFMLPGDGYYRE